jgi:hypothetical protein
MSDEKTKRSSRNRYVSVCVDHGPCICDGMDVDPGDWWDTHDGETVSIGLVVG